MKAHLSKYGYCGMTADFLHIGHINFLEECKKHCNKLIVGVMTDESVYMYKGKYPLMSQVDRFRLLTAISFVDHGMFQASFNYPDFVMHLKQSYGKDFLIFDSEEHKREGADIIIPRTEGVSSTQFRETHDDYFNIS
jgi:cytidyltransferase-like protein